MESRLEETINRLIKDKSLPTDEYEYLIAARTMEAADLLAKEAVKIRNAVYGNDIYIRGLIEISNICANDCLYCGIRKSNHRCERYRLDKSGILACCDDGYRLGYRTFVLQGGEDPYYTDDLICDIIKSIKMNYPDCAVTLSLGEKSFESYKRMFDAGADRYLLRHETADKNHYQKLHPDKMSYDNRIRCLNDLKKIGYQTGCGFMVGSPFQTAFNLAEDLKFIEKFRPQMCGIGPFISHKDTPFSSMENGSSELTCYLLSIIRIILPNVLLPATTALGTIDPSGREKGILSGANVVMPNLSPVSVRKKYELYDNKICTGDESAYCMECMKRRILKTGCRIVTDRGDIKEI